MKARRAKHLSHSLDQPAEPARSSMPRGATGREGTRCAIAALLVGGAVCFVYAQAVHAPWVFDDEQSVRNNPSIRRLWPLLGNAVDPGPLNPPKDFSTAGRPLVNFTLAVNYHYSRANSTGYHVLNMVLFGVSALLLWAIVRRTLRLEFFRGRFEREADFLALAVALLWGLHPLQTETVVYMTQRTELMVGLCYLATLYAALRYWTASARSWRTVWGMVATLTCLSGMACKEVMVSAPVVVLLFERTFLAGSFRRALGKSWPLYCGLLSGWALLAVLNHGGPRSQSAGFHLGVPAYVWWFTQAKVLIIYLKLCVWPWPLSIHYEIPYLETLADALPWLLPAALLGTAALLLSWRRTAAGFALAAMFLILSPTLVVPIVTEVAVERRMHLPLAALVALLVVGGYGLAQGVGHKLGTSGRAVATAPWPAVATAGICLLLAVVWGAVSIRRSAAYLDTVTLWQDALARYPESRVIYTNLGAELLKADRLPEAIAVSRHAVDGGHADAGIRNNLGTCLVKLGDRDGYQAGQLDEAISQLYEALRLDPTLVDARLNLAFALLAARRTHEAVGQCVAALADAPNNPHALYAMGAVQATSGDRAAAIDYYRQALARNIDSAEGHYGLGLVLLDEKETDEAILHLEAALRTNPRFAEAHYVLGVASTKAGDLRAAARHFTNAVELRPNDVRAMNNLGAVQMNLKETDKAIQNFAEAVRRNPDYAEAKDNLERARKMQTPSPPE